MSRRGRGGRKNVKNDGRGARGTVEGRGGRWGGSTSINDDLEEWSTVDGRGGRRGVGGQTNVEGRGGRSGRRGGRGRSGGDRGGRSDVDERDDRSNGRGGRSDGNGRGDQSGRKLENKKIAIAGFSEEDTEDLISFVKENGGVVVGLVERQTAFVVAGPDAFQKGNSSAASTTKLKRAKQHSISVVNSFFLYAAIYGNNFPDPKKYPAPREATLPLITQVYPISKKELIPRFFEAFPEMETSPYKDILSKLWESEDPIRKVPLLSPPCPLISQLVGLEESVDQTPKLVSLLKAGFHRDQLCSKLLVLEVILTLLDYNCERLDFFFFVEGLIGDVVEYFFTKCKSNVLQCAITSIITNTFQNNHFLFQRFFLENSEIIRSLCLHFSEPHLLPHLWRIANLLETLSKNGHIILSEVLSRNDWKSFTEKKLRPTNEVFSFFGGDLKPPPRPIKDDNSVFNFAPEEVEEIFRKQLPPPGVGKTGLLEGVKCGNFSECGKIENSEIQFSRCARCKKVVYCSVDCQKAHWGNSHKAECKV